jgi:hypothetical protein
MDLLDRLHLRLRTALSSDSGSGSGPLTIGDLYQRLIPYRAMRFELGVMELAEYEHALLRLLAGERAYLEVGEAEALREVRRELASPNPILGIYRDFAGSPVRIAEGRLPPPGAATVPASPPPAMPAAPSAAPQAPPQSAPAAPATSRPCAACGRGLPDGEDVRFCPYCGRTCRSRSCPGCGTPLEGGWRFCIRCGAARGRDRPGR